MCRGSRLERRAERLGIVAAVGYATAVFIEAEAVEESENTGTGFADHLRGLAGPLAEFAMGAAGRCYWKQE